MNEKHPSSVDLMLIKLVEDFADFLIIPAREKGVE